MRTSICAALLGLVFVVAIPGAASAQGTITLHGATQFGDAHPYNKLILRFQELVPKYYGKPVNFVLHRNGELGTEKEYFDFMNQGISVDYGIVSPAFMSTIVKAAPLLDMPFLFRDLDHLNKVLAADTLKPIADEVLAKGDVMIIGYAGGGTRNIIAKKPVRNMAELRDLSIRVMGAPIQSKVFAAIGARPSVIAYNEVYNAIQSGVVQGAENEAASLAQMRFYEVSPAVSLTKHAITVRPHGLLRQVVPQAAARPSGGHHQGRQGGGRLRARDRVQGGRRAPRAARERGQAQDVRVHRAAEAARARGAGQASLRQGDWRYRGLEPGERHQVARLVGVDYQNLGQTDLRVSRLCIGCMTFGVPERGKHNWTLPEAMSRPVIRKALDLGYNFFDTANVYSDGTSEEITGRALRDFVPRHEVVIATKVHERMFPGPEGGGLSRRAIFAAIDASLRRLETDYVDLYQIHHWDNEAPIAETVEALHDVVKAGKARYVGASSMYAWQFAKALRTAERNGWTRFATMQNYINLLYREEERDMLPLCADEGVGVMVWSPLARGRLTRDWGESNVRMENDAFGRTLISAHTANADREVIQAVAALANARNVSRAQVALAWLLQKSPPVVPIVGAASERELAEAAGALSLVLTPDEIAALERPYVAHGVVGIST